MGDVINLNRFRKKKAREEKERRAETNRRLHGRTKAERAREDADKKRLEKKIDGAFLVRETVGFDDVPDGDQIGDFEKLEAASRDALSLQEFSALLSGSEALSSRARDSEHALREEDSTQREERATADEQTPSEPPLR
jgi:Domain of unknown function (DUF4169)